jgi:carboxylesterase
MFVPFLVAAVAATALRVAAARHAERVYARRRPPGPAGVVTGAEGFSLEGRNGRALLLLHGSGDTPQTLRYLGMRLRDAGYAVHVPLLPGHGRGLRDFAAATADDYWRSALGELDALAARHAWVGIIGLSMGGAIAARLAAQRSDVRALVLLAPYLTPPASVTLAGRLAPLWRLAVPYLGGRGGESSVHDPVARAESLAYGTFPPKAIRALVATAAAGRRALPAIAVPTLVVQSREDNRIPERLAGGATTTIGGPVERHRVTGCGHVITVDYCREQVGDLVLDFLARRAD